MSHYPFQHEVAVWQYVVDGLVFWIWEIIDVREFNGVNGIQGWSLAFDFFGTVSLY